MRRLVDILPTNAPLDGGKARDYLHHQQRVRLVEGVPFCAVGGGLACAYRRRGGDVGVHACGGEGEGVDEVKELDSGIGGGAGVDFDAVERGGVGGEGDVVGGG